MHDFIQELHEIHNLSIREIRRLTDVNSELVNTYPEYKEAAILCKFILDYEYRCELIAKNHNYGKFYDSASEFVSLCEGIYHSLVDDGDIAFVSIADYICPQIAFKSRWELTLEDIISESQSQVLKSINEFKAKRGLPTMEFKLTFYNNAYEYIEAVQKHNTDALARREQAKSIIKNAHQSKEQK